MIKNAIERMTGLDKLQEGLKFHSAVQFKNVANTPEDGFQGGTMNPYTGSIVKAGETPLHFVGGHPKGDGTGRIETAYYDTGKNAPKLTTLDVMKERDRVISESGADPTVALGAWVDPKAKRKGVQMDASTSFPSSTDESVIRNLLEQRNEKESFNASDYSAVKNKKYVNPNKGK
jgi:hypothetical protein